MKDNPLDRIRVSQFRAIESGEHCSSITVHADGPISCVLPYSYLQGSTLENGVFMLFHSLAIAEISGPETLLAEILHLVSKQHLALVRHGLDGLAITLSLNRSSVT